MPDLTLDEFRDLPQEKLNQILRDEAKRINCSGPGKNNPSKKLKTPVRFFKQLRFYSQRLFRSTSIIC